MFAPCEAPGIMRSYYSVTSTSVTGDDTAICSQRFQVTYNVGHPPPTAMIQISTTVVPDLDLESEIPTPWARKGALYQPMSKVKDVWRAKWRLSQQRPRDGLHYQK